MNGDDSGPWFTESPLDGGTIRLAVAGDIDLATATALRHALRRPLREPGLTRLVVDLAEVGFLDAAGVAALVSGYQEAQAGDVAFQLVNCRPAPLRVLEIVGLDKLLTSAQP
ncbi:MAG: hypothetical protein AUG44_07320 [Actinobacteria bacterium 13_1_20CM_3_71_11]|nr:MAG: hypothetical protein AUG44_07320 [Actinobacteria bacterium 13_1_20CM_3_71_11]